MAKPGVHASVGLCAVVSRYYRVHVMVFETGPKATREFGEKYKRKMRIWYRTFRHFEALLDVFQLASYYSTPEFLNISVYSPETNVSIELLKGLNDWT